VSRHALALIALASLVAGCGGQHEEAPPNPTATVTLAPVRSETLKDVASLYGVVQAEPAGTTLVAAPRALIVGEIMVRTGQSVGAGQALIEVASAPGADLAWRQAANALTAANADLARSRRLFAGHLIASDQLDAASKAQADAAAGVAAQKRQGGGAAHQVLAAPAAAIVTNLAVSPGDHVAQDAPLVTLARQGAVSVKLGLEPSVGHVAAGQPVTVFPLNGGKPVVTRLSMVAGASDPNTRVVDASAPVGGSGLAIGAPVRAEVVTGVRQGLAIPRQAVVFDETGSHVFVVERGHARRVFVTVGHDYGDQVEVSGPIKAGQQVAVQGAYELRDGMAVVTAKR
jgi:RND family efflux transporter MFP subunit